MRKFLEWFFRGCNVASTALFLMAATLFVGAVLVVRLAPMKVVNERCVEDQSGKLFKHAF